MSSFAIPLGDNFAQTLQERALLDHLTTALASGNIQAFAQAVAAALTSGVIVNLLRNSDLNTSDAGRRGFTYSIGGGAVNDAANVCAFWYAPGSAAAGPFVDSVTATESPDAIAAVKYVSDGAISTGSPHALSMVTATFLASDVGRAVWIDGALGGAPLITTISAFTDSTHVTVTAAATSTVSGKLVRIYNAGASTVWNLPKGYVEWGGAFTLMSPLEKNFVRPGVANSIFIIGSVRLNPDTGALPLTDGYRVRVSCWDNTAGQVKIIEGAPIPISAALIRGAGAVTRKYIVKYFTAAGDFWFSDAVSPVAVTSTPDPTAVDPGQVEVTFPTYPGVRTYEVYRSDSVAGFSNFYRIATESTGISSAQDVGGRFEGPYTIAAKNWRAQAFAAGVIGSGWSPISFHILTPATYNLGITAANSQWLRFDIVDASGAVVSIPPWTLNFDFAGFSYASGKWQMSASDQQAAGDFESKSPSPSGGIPSGGGGDPGGGGSIGRGGNQDLGF